MFLWCKFWLLIPVSSSRIEGGELWESEWVSRWVSGWTSEWVNKWTSEWVGGWVSGCVSEPWSELSEYQLWWSVPHVRRWQSMNCGTSEPTASEWGPVNKTITHQITQRYVHSLFVDYKNGNKCQILRMRHWTTANIKITFIVYHERRYIITEAHSEGIPKLRPVLAVREVTSWVVKEMVDSVFSYLWGK